MAHDPDAPIGKGVAAAWVFMAVAGLVIFAIGVWRVTQGDKNWWAGIVLGGVFAVGFGHAFPKMVPCLRGGKCPSMVELEWWNQRM